MARLLVTRPDPDATRTARSLRMRGHDVLVSPAIRIEPIDAHLPEDGLQAVLVTSANAVRALQVHGELQSLQHLPLYAVGDRTAAEAHHLGFASVDSAHGNAADLAELIRERVAPSDGPLLYLAADRRAGHLEDELAAAGFSVILKEIYRSTPAETLTPEAKAALADGEEIGILVYSAESAAAFARAVEAAGLRPLKKSATYFCLSEQMAGPLRNLGEGPILVANRPNEASLFELIEGRR
ncbi:uroporphyrinogen-III synthase [Afifella sp. IM 167]|uniref:uroporphyrinogen-III synthase n=1 Tax=Afifella sp. IM 167 TaxID=2033586 RepID=UPI001CCD0E18|nr:uroporphyrinogen-III synthase [Afifella sp. IM 167]MBZ8134946.1 uroporphyrinogen III synthase HEM4 [Afifella sp. IM 167]